LSTNDVPGEGRRLNQKWIDVAEGRLTLDASLIDLGADSLVLRKEFGVDIPDDEAAKTPTVGQAIGATRTSFGREVPGDRDRYLPCIFLPSWPPASDRAALPPPRSHRRALEK
jgi:acyl carrier protein